MRQIECHDFMHYRFLSHLAVEPQHRYAAFVVSGCDIARNTYRSYLYLIDLRTCGVRQLTSGGRERSFLWLDHRHILYPCRPWVAGEHPDGEPSSTYFLLDVDDGVTEVFMDIPLQHILKLRHLGGEQFLVLARTAGGHEGAKDEPGYHLLYEVPFWADGIGFTSGTRNRLYLFDRETAELTAISGETEQVQFFDVHAGKIIYSASHFTHRQSICSGVVLWADGKRTVLVPYDRYRIHYCGFVGDTIVFAGSEMKRYGAGENPWFYTVSEQGDIRLLLAQEKGVVSSVITDCKYGGGGTFRVYENSLYYLSTEWGDTVVRKLSLDGTLETIWDRPGTIDCFDMVRNRILFIGMREHRLQEIYLMRDRGETMLTGFNKTVLQGKALSAPQHLEAQSDGAIIGGYVMRPVGFDPAKKYPAILTIHEGPKAVYGSAFFHELQYFAGEGYFVFYCNPRGSDGRGNDFSDLRGRYGTVDYNDIMRFTDSVLKAYPQIDPARVGVTGGSYGGFMTNWIIGHSHRFRCAVSQRGISSWQTFFATSECGVEMVADQQQATPWTDSQKLWDRSPLKYADRVKTPTLFLHADADYRCWLVEGLQMFMALKYHGVPTKLWVFREGTHQLSRAGKPAHRCKRLEVMVEWFDLYLKRCAI